MANIQIKDQLHEKLKVFCVNKKIKIYEAVNEALETFLKKKGPKNENNKSMV